MNKSDLYALDINLEIHKFLGSAVVFYNSVQNYQPSNKLSKRKYQ